MGIQCGWLCVWAHQLLGDFTCVVVIVIILWVVMDLWSAVARGVFGAGSGFMGLGAVIAFYGD